MGSAEGLFGDRSGFEIRYSSFWGFLEYAGLEYHLKSFGPSLIWRLIILRLRDSVPLYVVNSNPTGATGLMRRCSITS